MSIRQTLLYVTTFPDPPPVSLLEGAVTVAALLKSALTAQAPELDSDPATWRPVMGGFAADYMQVMAEIAADSKRHAAACSETLTRLCKDRKVALDLRRGLTQFNAPAKGMVELARLHDLVILPAPTTDTIDHSLLHAAIFQSGRPVLLLPPERPVLREIARAVVAWDGSREAARALKDAMPLLALADDIHIVSVIGETGKVAATAAADLEKFMGAHGLSFSFHREEKQFTPVAERLLNHATAIRANLLVMGAYGHSRMAEFILGGATRGALKNPPLPILLSH